MRCQHCHQNEATIRLNMQINSVHKQMVLCETCYNELTRKPSMSMGPQSFGFPFEQAFQPKEKSAAKQSGKKGLLDELAQNILQTVQKPVSLTPSSAVMMKWRE